MDEYIYSQSVHKDFHQVMSFLIDFLGKNYKSESVKEFFLESTPYIYRPFIERIRKNGLSEISKHYRRIFDMECGDYIIERDTDKEVLLKVKKCPAIWNMKEAGFIINKDFCFYTTELVNKVIAGECGYEFSVEYDQENGKCSQRFWRK